MSHKGVGQRWRLTPLCTAARGSPLWLLCSHCCFDSAPGVGDGSEGQLDRATHEVDLGLTMNSLLFIWKGSIDFQQQNPSIVLQTVQSK